MKFKLLSLAVFCALGLSASAQTEKGKNLIGGSLYYFSSDSEQFGSTYVTSKQKEHAFGPAYGHFISNNFAIGLGVSFRRSSVKNSYVQSTSIGDDAFEITYTIDDKQTNTSIRPFARYYVDIADKFKFFGQFDASIGVTKANNRAVPEAPSVKNTAIGASLSPSLAFFPTKRIAVELGFSLLSYYRTLVNDDTRIKAESFRFGFDSFNPSFGVNLHF